MKLPDGSDPWWDTVYQQECRPSRDKHPAQWVIRQSRSLPGAYVVFNRVTGGASHFESFAEACEVFASYRAWPPGSLPFAAATMSDEELMEFLRTTGNL